MCQPQSQLRFWASKTGSTSEDRATAIRSSVNCLLFISPEVWGSREVLEDIKLASLLGKTIMMIYKPSVAIHIKTQPFTFPELQVICLRVCEILNKNLTVYFLPLY